MLRKLGAIVATGAVGAAVAVVPAQAVSSKTVSVKNNAFSPKTVKIDPEARQGRLEVDPGRRAAQRHPCERQRGLEDLEQEGLHVLEDLLARRARSVTCARSTTR